VILNIILQIELETLRETFEEERRAQEEDYNEVEACNKRLEAMVKQTAEDIATLEQQNKVLTDEINALKAANGQIDELKKTLEEA
jgi:SMC interacting uncharacterized protein involved in chromosome segregation